MHARSLHENGHLRTVDAGTDSPATRFLEALHRGDLTAALAECTDATTVTAETMGWSCQGLDAIECAWVLARERFAGLTYERTSRSVGFGQVFEDGRVRDLEDLATRVDDEAPTRTERSAAGTGEEPAPAEDADDLGPNAMTVAEIIAALDAPPVPVAQRQLVVWRDMGDPGEVPPLNMPVRVTVRHDDLQVHEVSLGFPAALLKRALGQRVDPLEISLSEVQSAFMSQSGTTFTSQTLDRPVLTVVPPLPAEPEQAVVAEEPPRPRRRRLVLVTLAVVALLAGAGWWAVQGLPAGSRAAAQPVATSTDQPAPRHDASTGTTTATPPPQRTSRPAVTLKSDLAFGFNSSTLSAPAKAAIAQLAQHIRNAGPQGKVFVDGYTDNLGPAAYGQVLSQHRADAVAGYLRSRLGNAPVRVVATGHGESSPIASNATAAGRRQNRRVTITLPTA
jgi:outer membrane protein OmpA-like peptidoglycan-associated protein